MTNTTNPIWFKNNEDGGQNGATLEISFGKEVDLNSLALAALNVQSIKIYLGIYDEQDGVIWEQDVIDKNIEYSAEEYASNNALYF